MKFRKSVDKLKKTFKVIKGSQGLYCSDYVFELFEDPCGNSEKDIIPYSHFQFLV